MYISSNIDWDDLLPRINHSDCTNVRDNDTYSRSDAQDYFLYWPWRSHFIKGYLNPCFWTDDK